MEGDLPAATIRCTQSAICWRVIAPTALPPNVAMIARTAVLLPLESLQAQSPSRGSRPNHGFTPEADAHDQKENRARKPLEQSISYHNGNIVFVISSATSSG